MANVKSGASAPKKAPPPSAPPKASAKPAAGSKPGPKSDAPAAKTARAPAETKEKKPSAASRFQELIMEGKRTDDEIFSIVQKEHGLPDSKRNYVTWYRNYLKKQGKAPPPAIGGDEPKKDSAPAKKAPAAAAKSGPPKKKSAD